MEIDTSSNPTFAELKPSPHPLLLENIRKMMKFEHTTEIQAKTWQPASEGVDVLGRARTGTGKTVSFLLPALHRLLQTSSKDLPKNTIHMLVLSPTRELASQIDDQAQILTEGSQLTHQVIFGGASKPKDIQRLERTVPTVLVATPGRLRDHLQGTRIKGTPFSQLLGKTSVLVLDETDRLLDMGFRKEVEDIISYLPNKKHRQTLLFSATVPPEVKAVMAATMNPNFVTVDCIHDKDPSSHTNAQVEQRHVVLRSKERQVTGAIDVIFHIMEQAKANGEPLKMVVFFCTANLVAYYAELFNDHLDIPVLELHSRKSQSFRTKTADQFRAADEAILFTSDVSARGVDYPGVTNVVQFGIADSRESYIHRLGRTGRAGKVGEGLLVLSDLEVNFLRTLKGLSVPPHVELQAILDGRPTSKTVSLTEPLFASIKNGGCKSLSASARSAYRSMLGFYNGKLPKLTGVKGTDQLVDFVNEFAFQTGLNSIPELETKTVKKMGLVGARGLNVVQNGSAQDSKPSQKSNSGRGDMRSGSGGRNSSSGRGGGRGAPRSSQAQSHQDLRNGTTTKRHNSTTSEQESSTQIPKKPKPGRSTGPENARSTGGRGRNNRSQTNNRNRSTTSSSAF